MDLNDLIKNPEQIQSMINLLEGMLKLQQKASDQSDEETIQPKKKKSGANKGIGRTQKQQKSNNKFENMAEFSMHKNDSEIDKKLSKNPPVARMREFEMVDVVCRICGKKETVNPSLVLDSVSRYKCNNCSTQAG